MSVLYQTDDKQIPKCYVNNCEILGVGDDGPIFTATPEAIYAHLDGYIIARKDKYKVVPL